MRYLIRLEDDEALDPALVGHKFASLARAHRAGLPVPPAIVLSVEAHLQFIGNGEWPSGVLDQVLQTAAELGISQGLSVRSSATVEDLAGGSFAGQYRTFLNVRDQIELKEKIEGCWASSGSVARAYYARFSDRDRTVKQKTLMAVILQKMVQ
ncbi:MAG: PEP/pyruvate-binding domain-containing protein, partial [Desulfoferrobacter sp.]